MQPTPKVGCIFFLPSYQRPQKTACVASNAPKRRKQRKSSVPLQSSIFNCSFFIFHSQMGIHKIKSKTLVRLGLEKGSLAGLALDILRKHFKHSDEATALARLQEVVANPAAFVADVAFGPLALKLMPEPAPVEGQRHALLDAGLGYRAFGADGIDEGTVAQMDLAMRLPVTRGGALMPDAHLGYGLPIGGVLATAGVVIPYAVGMDIGCRMCLTVTDLPAITLQRDRDRLRRIVKDNSRFGKEAFDDPFDDEVLNRAAFSELPILRQLKATAARQIGSSGSGNHFVELGIVEFAAPALELGLPAGAYVGILTHSGSRALGATVAQHYTDWARQRCILPKSASHFAWLDLDSEAGQEYWLSMNLAGDYASACHHHIHRRLLKALGAEERAVVENHHNFAWKEVLPTGEEAIVHRKGATPAAKGEWGIIPGSMLQPGFVVRGKGLASSLQSASHGAGRQLSRARATNSITRHALQKQLDKADITLIGGSPEEAPDAYKDIFEVMAAQQDLVEVIAQFQPKIVRMDK
jgi:tRNA-splicing ligase RtcB (3'-phosphate/5'-hydroxy nucleic acid ligase)